MSWSGALLFAGGIACGVAVTQGYHWYYRVESAEHRADVAEAGMSKQVEEERNLVKGIARVRDGSKKVESAVAASDLAAVKLPPDVQRLLSDAQTLQARGNSDVSNRPVP